MHRHAVEYSTYPRGPRSGPGCSVLETSLFLLPFLQFLPCYPRLVTDGAQQHADRAAFSATPAWCRPHVLHVQIVSLNKKASYRCRFEESLAQGAGLSARSTGPILSKLGHFLANPAGTGRPNRVDDLGHDFLVVVVFS